MEKKKFTVFFEYIMAGEMVVEADNLDDAMDKVEDMDELPPGAEYVDSSFQVNKELTIDMNDDVDDPIDMDEELIDGNEKE